MSIFNNRSYSLILHLNKTFPKITNKMVTFQKPIDNLTIYINI